MEGIAIGILLSVIAFGVGAFIGTTKWFDQLMTDIGNFLGKYHV